MNPAAMKRALVMLDEYWFARLKKSVKAWTKRGQSMSADRQAQIRTIADDAEMAVVHATVFRLTRVPRDRLRKSCR